MNCVQDIIGREETVSQLESLMSGAGEEINLVVWTHSLDSIKENPYITAEFVLHCSSWNTDREAGHLCL